MLALVFRAVQAAFGFIPGFSSFSAPLLHLRLSVGFPLDWRHVLLFLNCSSFQSGLYLEYSLLTPEGLFPTQIIPAWQACPPGPGSRGTALATAAPHRCHHSQTGPAQLSLSGVCSSTLKSSWFALFFPAWLCFQSLQIHVFYQFWKTPGLLSTVLCRVLA